MEEKLNTCILILPSYYHREYITKLIANVPNLKKKKNLLRYIRYEHIKNEGIRWIWSYQRFSTETQLPKRCFPLFCGNIFNGQLNVNGEGKQENPDIMPKYMFSSSRIISC